MHAPGTVCIQKMLLGHVRLKKLLQIIHDPCRSMLLEPILNQILTEKRPLYNKVSKRGNFVSLCHFFLSFSVMIFIMPLQALKMIRYFLLLCCHEVMSIEKCYPLVVHIYTESPLLSKAGCSVSK